MGESQGGWKMGPGPRVKITVTTMPHMCMYVLTIDAPLPSPIHRPYSTPHRCAIVGRYLVTCTCSNHIVRDKICHLGPAHQRVHRAA
jgi:hypothetical protein